MRRLVPLAFALALACDRPALAPASNDAAPTSDGAAPTEVAPGSDALPHGNPARLPDGGCVEGAFVGGGGCACDPAEPDVCDERCTDTNLDPDNCGACDRRCAPTAACIAGSCGSAPVVYQAPPPTGCKSLHLATDGIFLYWTDEGNGTVLRAAPTAGVPSAIASNEDRPRELVALGGRVFWLTGDPTPVLGPSGTVSGPPRSIRMAQGAGVDATTIVTAAFGIGGLTASPDGATVYYSTGVSVVAVSPRGEVSHSVRGYPPHALALDGTTLVYTDIDDGGIHVVTLVDGQDAICDRSDPGGVSTAVSCLRPQSDNGELFEDTILIERGLTIWADGNELRGYDVATGQFHPITRQYIEATTGFTNITGLTLAGETVLSTNDEPSAPTTSSGTVWKTATATVSTPLMIARGQNAPSSPVFASNRVYWSTGDCAIWSVAP